MTEDNATIDGRYEVLDTLGRGAFGHTLLARVVDSDQRVAIKTLHPERADTLKAFELFEREAKVLGNLRHQGIPAILESLQAEYQGQPAAFLVMEYVEGPTLEQLIQDQHSFSTDDVLALVHDLAAILEYLHERVPPIIHRDIKPSNVILRNGKHPVLVDFGAVRNVFRAPEDGGSTVVGTYGYMPYEQYMGQATPSSDIYALGATLLHLLTGRPPGEFLTDDGKLDVPDTLPGGDRMRYILGKMVAPTPADRFASAGELRRSLLDQPTSLPVPTSGRAVALANAGQTQAIVNELSTNTGMLEGARLELFHKRAPSTWQMINTMGVRADNPNAGSIALAGFLSLISIGVLPLMFWFMSMSHRRRLKPFFEDGRPAWAEIQGIIVGGSNMGERLARVTYEFEADGAIHRGADQIIPTIADRWRAGDAIPVLYLPDRNYDSVIVTT